MIKNNLGIIIFENCEELGQKVLTHIKDIRKNEANYRIPIKESRFNDGSGKVSIKESVRDKDLYILTDVENPSCTYRMYGDIINHKSPDDHFTDLRRVISAISGHTRDFSVYMPFLIYGRQHSGINYESNDCADALKDLVDDGSKAIITHDVHSPGVKHSLARTSTEFQNIFATNYIVRDFLDNEDIDLNNLLIVAPDEGAIKRAKYYSSVFLTDIGFCYKQRDLTGELVNGKPPVKEHKYIGPSPKGMTVIIIDDIVSSGESILDTARLLRQEGASNIYLFSTFALFTEGLQNLSDKYDEKLFKKLYSTNLTYAYVRAIGQPWFHMVDCSRLIAEIISSMNFHESLTPIIEIKPEIMVEIQERKLKR